MLRFQAKSTKQRDMMEGMEEMRTTHSQKVRSGPQMQVFSSDALDLRPKSIRVISFGLVKFCGDMRVRSSYDFISRYCIGWDMLQLVPWAPAVSAKIVLPGVWPPSAGACASWGPDTACPRQRWPFPGWRFIDVWNASMGSCERPLGSSENWMKELRLQENQVFFSGFCHCKWDFLK